MSRYFKNNQTKNNCTVSFKQGHRPEPVDFHSHDYYEISLILSGHIKTILRHKSEDGTKNRLVLSAPGTPHLVFMSAPSHYARLNLYFEADFMEHCISEWGFLSRVFGKNGNIINLTREQCSFCETQLNDLAKENNPFRQKLRILTLLSHISELDGAIPEETTFSSPLVVDAVSYINQNYERPIIASELAKKLNTGRTTLMTSIKKHTGLTLSEYVMKVRVKKAIELLATGHSQEETAVMTGLGSGCGIIRAFKRCYGMTPGQYMKKYYENT